MDVGLFDRWDDRAGRELFQPSGQGRTDLLWHHRGGRAPGYGGVMAKLPRDEAAVMIGLSVGGPVSRFMCSGARRPRPQEPRGGPEDALTAT